MSIPLLKTERLVLRAMRPGDWPAYAALMGSVRARHMGGPFHARVAWGMFCADHAQWDLFGTGALMIEERATGMCLGQVGINQGPLFPEPELGWLVYPGAEGRGIAQEAARAMLDWARGRLPGLVSYVDADNVRSIRLAQRLGAMRDDAAPRPDAADLVFRHHL